MGARPNVRRDTSKGPMAVRATFWGCAAFLTGALATEPICVHMVVRLEFVPPSAGGCGPWERHAARQLPLLARALPGRAAAALGQAAIAAGIIAEGRSPRSRLRKPATATPAAEPQ